MTHRIHTAEDPVQPSSGDPSPDRTATKSYRFQLGDRDYPVLDCGDLCHRGIGTAVGLLPHTGNKSPGPVRSPPLADSVRDVEAESQLVEALRRGDEAAFARVVDEYTPALMRVALMHVPSRAVAEEVVQDTWLGVIKGIDRFEGRSSLRTWIFQILLNTARSRGEREKRVLPFAYFRRRAEEGGDEPAVDPDRFQGRRGEQPGAWASPPAEWSEPEHQLETAASRDVMLKAIRDLPPRQRDVITLRDIQGWPAQEVCNALELSETNQRVLLHRARSKVRAALEDYFEGSDGEGSTKR